MKRPHEGLTRRRLWCEEAIVTSQSAANLCSSIPVCSDSGNPRSACIPKEASRGLRERIEHMPARSSANSPHTPSPCTWLARSGPSFKSHQLFPKLQQTLFRVQPRLNSTAQTFCVCKNCHPPHFSPHQWDIYCSKRHWFEFGTQAIITELRGKEQQLGKNLYLITLDPLPRRPPLSTRALHRCYHKGKPSPLLTAWAL